MAEVIFDKVEKIYDNDVHAVHDLSLEIGDGEFVVLVGPSGCGKTTALRMVAGLEDITGGRVSIGGRVVNDLSPKERDIAMVFQNYALYPHLSVADNIGFGLRLRRTPKDVVEERVDWAAKLLGQTPYDSPKNLFVASFIGSPSMNIFEGTIERSGDALTVKLGDQELPVPSDVAQRRAALS